MNRTYHLSLVVKDSQGWMRPIKFRDYLIAHPQMRQKYQRLKEELSAKYASDRASYTAAKDEFIQEVLKLSV